MLEDINIDNISVSALKQLIDKAEQAYRLGDPIMTDDEFDSLVRKYVLYKSISDSESFDSESTTIQDDEGNMLHPNRMWSQPNAYDDKDLLTYIKKILKHTTTISEDEPIFIIEPKYDGVSLNLVYRDGVLVDAITRGNGYKGTSIISKVKHIKGIPIKVKSFIPLGIVEVRGELLISKSDLVLINKNREINNLPLFSNTRNLVAGSLALLDMVEFANRNIQFISWGSILGSSYDKTVLGNMEFVMSSSGVFERPVFYYSTTFLSTPKSPDEILIGIREVIDALKEVINKSDIDMDGLVVKANRLDLRDAISPSAKYENISTAYKYNDKFIVTKVTDLTHATSRFGRLTPVATLEPKELQGVVISNANLSNYSRISKMDLKINDTVKVVRSGDVVPKIVDVFYNLRTDSPSEWNITPPKNCPDCLSETTTIGKDLYCKNESCIGRLRAYFVYVLGKEVLNIKGISKSTISKIVNSEMSSLLSFLNITINELNNVESINSITLYDKIHNHKITEFYRILLCLNITGLGVSQAKALTTMLEQSNESNILKAYCKISRIYNSSNNIKKSIILDNVVAEMSTDKNDYIVEWLYNRLM